MLRTDLHELRGLFKYSDIVTGSSQGDSSSKAPKTSTNNQDIQFHLCFFGHSIFTS